MERLTGDAERRMAGFLARVATGPRMSKDLDAGEAREAMELILDGRVDPAQAAAFLIAMRMKRETDDELRGVLDAIRSRSARAVADVDDLVDVAEPYGGHVRHLSPVAFVPAVVAACGVPCVLHGVREAGPKWGLTPHRVLAAAGRAVALAPAAAAARVAEPDVGWAYVDLPQICPGLAALARLRALIVKRPCLSLVEKLIAPVSGRRTHLVAGYTHRSYPDILYALAGHAGYASLLAVRGVEGGVVPSLAAARAAVRASAGGELEELSLDPAAAGGPYPQQAPPLPELSGEVTRPEVLDALAAAAARAGEAALAGAAGPTREALAVAAAAILHHVGRAASLADGVARARDALDSGAARARFLSG